MTLSTLKASIDQAEVMITRAALAAKESSNPDPEVVMLIGSMQSMAETMCKAVDEFISLQSRWGQALHLMHENVQENRRIEESRHNRIRKWFRKRFRRENATQ